MNVRPQGRGSTAHPPEPYQSFRSGIARTTLRRSILRIAGADALDFLHRMSTNDVRSLAPGGTCRTVIVNEKGRIIDLVTVVWTGADAVVVGSAGAGRSVALWLEKFVIMDDVRISAVTDDTGLAALFGPGAEAAVRAMQGAVPDVSAGAGFALKAGGTVHIVEEDLGGLPGYLFVPGVGAPPEHPMDAHSRVPGAGTGSGPAGVPTPLPIAPADAAAYEAVRIEECVPLLGRELGPEVNALEAGLKQYVSFTKGCYIGQEVIARIDTYGKLQNLLSLFMIPGFEGETLPPGPVFREGADAGRITSTTWSPRHEAWIGLGYRRVRTDTARLEFLPGGAGVRLSCHCLPVRLKGYEEYEIGT